MNHFYKTSVLTAYVSIIQNHFGYDIIKSSMATKPCLCFVSIKCEKSPHRAFNYLKSLTTLTTVFTSDIVST